MMGLTKVSRRINANCLLQGNHAALGAHKSARFSYHNLEALLRNLFLPVAVGATMTKIHLRLWWVSFRVSCSRVAVSFLSEALSICLLRFAARMGRSTWVTHHGRVQLPESVHFPMVDWLGIFDLTCPSEANNRPSFGALMSHIK